ncbi:MAG: JAB domain-containing protein [Puia sp.]|nr:JAB domain-containing protein [Puia sp.]
MSKINPQGKLFEAAGKILESHSIPRLKLVYRSGRKVGQLPIISNSSDMYEYFIKDWDLSTIELVEQFKVCLVNNAGMVLGICNLSLGTRTSVAMDPALIVALALLGNATGIILAHNHPSGLLIPGEADERVTTGIKRACDLMGIQLLDHLIVSRYGYFSFLGSEKL